MFKASFMFVTQGKMQDRLLFTIISFLWSKTVFSSPPTDVFSHCPKYVPEGGSLRCDCQRWPTIAGSVTWPRHSNNSTLIVTNVTRGDNGTVFTCLVTQGGVRETRNYTLLVAYGPVSVNILAPSPFISDGTNYLHVTCVATEVNPVPRVTWNINTCLNNNTDNGSCVMKPQPPWGDGDEVRCTATNRFGPGKLTTTYKLNLAYPPPTPPKILDYKPGQVLANGDQLRCNVSGGKPLVKKVNFSCFSDPPLEDQQDTIEGSSVLSNVTINTNHTEGHSMVCVCSAIWEPREDLYTETSNVTVFVRSKPQETKIPSTKIETGIAVAFPVVIFFILVIIIAVVILVKNRGRRKAMDKKNLESSHQRDNLSQQNHTISTDYEDVETPRNQPTSNIHNLRRSRRPGLSDVIETEPSSQEITFPNEDNMISSREDLCEFSSQLSTQDTMQKVLSWRTEDEPIYTEIDPPTQDLDFFTATTDTQTTCSSSGSATRKMPAAYNKFDRPQASISSPKLKKSRKGECEPYNTLQHC